MLSVRKLFHPDPDLRYQTPSRHLAYSGYRLPEGNRKCKWADLLLDAMIQACDFFFVPVPLTQELGEQKLVMFTYPPFERLNQRGSLVLQGSASQLR